MSNTSPSPLITQPGTLRPMLRLALPVLAEQLLNMSVGLTDRYLAGQFFLGDEYLAAMNQSAYLLWLLSSLFAAVSIGTTALVARFTGGGELNLARHTANQALLLGAAFATVIGLCGVLFGPSILAASGLSPAAIELASRYLGIVLLALPAILLEQVGIAALRGAGDTVSGLWAMAAMNGVNVIVSFGLVSGIGPFPKIGWDGLAIGTAGGYAVGALVILWRLQFGPAGLRLSSRELKPDVGLQRRLLRVGLPGGFDMLAIVGCHLWFVGIVNRLGGLASAAHGVAVAIEAISYLPGVAFQVAAATLAGQYLGAGDPRRAGRAVLTACVVGGGLMCSAGVLFYFGGGWLADLLVSDRQPEISQLAGQLLKIVAITQPFLATFMIMVGALRGAGDTRWPLLFTFVGFLLVRIPLAYFFAWETIELPLGLGTIAGMGWGVRGAWYAMALDLMVRCALVLYRFFHGGWKRVRV